MPIRSRRIGAGIQKQRWRSLGVPLTWTPELLAGVTMWLSFHFEQSLASAKARINEVVE
jgi:hypothetical protein